MKSLSQLKKLSVEQLTQEFVGSSFPFDFADCSSCIVQHKSGCDDPLHHLLMIEEVAPLMRARHGKRIEFGDRLEKNLTKLYKLRVKYASFFPTPVPTKFPRKKVAKRRKVREAAPTLHSIYADSTRNRRREQRGVVR